MPCCKCEEYDWLDKPKETYISETDGKEYCLFHAPHDEKKMDGEIISVDEFNEQVSERIQATIDLNDEEATCDFSGTVFPGNIKFPSNLPKISFKQTHFILGADFEGTTFNGEVLFDNAILGAGFSSFSRAIFTNLVSFSNTTVSGAIDFVKTTFDENAECSFSEIKCKGRANFCFSKFLGMTRFDKSNFESHALFVGSYFKRSCLCSFRGTIFSYNADFSAAIFDSYKKPGFCMSRLSFRSVVFNGDANFNCTKFRADVDFTSAEFGENGMAIFNFSMFHKQVFFDKTIFSGNSDFNAAVFLSYTFFTNVVFAEEVSFGIEQLSSTGNGHSVPETCDFPTEFINHTSFKSVTFGNGASFVSFDYNSDTTIKFADCKVLSGSIVFSFCKDPTCLDLTQQYDLTNIRFINSPWEKEGQRIKVCTEENSLQPTRDFYQRMKAKYKAENNEYEASRWHVAEKEAQLKLLAQSENVKFNWFMLWLYKQSSFFGEWPRRAFKVLLSLIALPLLFLLVAASADVQIDFLGWTFHSSPTADVIGEWLKYIPLTRAMAGEPSSGWRALMFLWQLLITIQAALFAFALRNNFRR